MFETQQLLLAGNHMRCIPYSFTLYLLDYLLDKHALKELLLSYQILSVTDFIIYQSTSCQINGRSVPAHSVQSTVTFRHDMKRRVQEGTHLRISHAVELGM
jgi:hypothetical protein